MPLLNKAIEIEVYKPHWARGFLELKSVLCRKMGSLVLAIEHVGSTSVKGLGAKPILDIDIVIENNGAFLLVIEELEKLGYYHQGNLGIEGREAFGRKDNLVPWSEKKRDWMEHHLYVCPQYSKELIRHLAFRDYLQSHPQIAKEYEQIKRNLAASEKYRESYTLGKSEFVEKVLDLSANK